MDYLKIKKVKLLDNYSIWLAGMTFRRFGFGGLWKQTPDNIFGIGLEDMEGLLKSGVAEQVAQEQSK